MNEDLLKDDEYQDGILETFLNKSKVSQEASDFRMSLAARIYYGMKAKGWSQTKFAEIMGKKDSVISKWLSGTHNFESDTLFEIQRILCINLFDLGKNDGNAIITANGGKNYTKNVFLTDKEYSQIKDQGVSVFEFVTESKTQTIESCVDFKMN